MKVIIFMVMTFLFLAWSMASLALSLVIFICLLKTIELKHIDTKKVAQKPPFLICIAIISLCSFLDTAIEETIAMTHLWQQLATMDLFNSPVSINFLFLCIGMISEEIHHLLFIFSF